MKLIIPCFNTINTLRLLLSHLASTGDIALSDIIVVDDGSSDGTMEMLKREFAPVNVLMGNGDLLWTGAIRLGMEQALRANSEFIFWLNHDCRPQRGAIPLILSTLQNPAVGCVSGWCHMAGYPDFPVNPGFRKLHPLDINSAAGDLVPADGLNGNFVGFRADAIQRVGLPDAKRHPHYGDGPYTYRFTKAGLGVLVNRRARAELDYEVLRRLPPFWRVALSRESFSHWLRYYFTSFKSQYHWNYRWNDAVAFRGWKAIFSYPKAELQAFFEVAGGVFCRLFSNRAALIEKADARFAPCFPMTKLKAEIAGEKH